MALSDEPHNQSYLSALLTLSGASASAAALLALGGLALGNVVLLHAAVSAGIACGCLLGVTWMHSGHAAEPQPSSRAVLHRASAVYARVAAFQRSVFRRGPKQPQTDESASAVMTELPEGSAPEVDGESARPRDPGGRIRLALGVFVALTTVLLLMLVGMPVYAPTIVQMGAGAAACAAAAMLTSMAVRYVVQIDADRIPERDALARGGRVLMWVFALAGASVVVQWAAPGGLLSMFTAMWLALAAINAAACYGLLTAPLRPVDAPPAFDVDFTFARILGARTNPFASVMDTAQAQLGIDLRSTWALEVARQAIEPLAIALLLVGWLLSSFTVVGVDEQGLVERFGVPLAAPPLEPGLHAHLPWPVDRVFRVPVRRVQRIGVGHEGEEEGGPEDVLWAVEHAANEYTLLLGNGRDLVTIDAAVQYRITDPRAWFYRSQNPVDALRAIAYRAVMRNTVNRTLADALSENIVTTTNRMRTMVQDDASALGLGVQVLDFTVGGMHPPVPVASDYQAVVSAELGEVTAVVNAQAMRNRTVPYAESDVEVGANRARQDGAEMLAQAAGDAWAFRTLEAQYRASPAEYQFRARLEAFESALAYRRFTILDARIQRDRGELWITP